MPNVPQQMFANSARLVQLHKFSKIDIFNRNVFKYKGFLVVLLMI